MIIFELFIPLAFILAGFAALAQKGEQANIYTLDGKRKNPTSGLPDRDQFREWSELLRNSNEQAFTELFREMYNPLLLFALKYVSSRAEAKDILQNTFIKVWNIRTQIEPDKSLKALLYQMTKNNCLNHLKARHGDELTEHIMMSLEDEQPLPDVQNQSADELELYINQWIQELPARQQEAFELSRFDGLDHKEIADVMDCKPRTVNNHIVGALQTLRSKVENYLKNRNKT